MQVLLEKSSGLERRLRITLLAKDIADEVKKRVQSTSKEVRIDGFRPGKIPLNVIEKRYGDAIRHEVLNKLIQSACEKAVVQEKIYPAAAPRIDFVSPLDDIKKTDTDFVFTAVFEVYPEIQLADLSSIKISKPVASVMDTDVDKALATLRSQHATYHTVDREAQNGDRVLVDFEGKIDGKVFEGGTAKQVEIDLGAKRFITGFEEGLVGVKAGEEKTLKVTFPQTYQVEALAGKPAEFFCHIHEIKEPVVAEVDDEFCKKIGVSEGGEDALRTMILRNMTDELNRTQEERVKEQVMAGLLKINQFDVPQSLVKQEAAQLRKSIIEQHGGEDKNDDLDNLPSMEMFTTEAKRRVSLGLIMGEIIKQNKIKVNDEQLRQTLEGLASRYKEPERVMQWYYSNPEKLSQVKYSILENMAVESVLSDAQVIDDKCTYQDVMHPDKSNNIVEASESVTKKEVESVNVESEQV